ncbi:MAG: transcription-repair coupling factor [Desulfobacterales bacterium]|nr:transcription-repair coupling factor [Desulfobacterales bacterium]
MNRFLAALTPGRNCNLIGLRGSAAAMVSARAAAVPPLPGTVLCVAASEHHAEVLEQDLGFFAARPVVRYPAYDIPPYIPLSPDPATVATRLATLYQLFSAETPLIVVTSAEALLRRVLPPGVLSSLAELVISNEECDQDELRQRLINAGYESVALVRTVGEFSVRGGIFDVFPPGFTTPVRLDFFGDLVESIRTFDPVSQRSLDQLQEVVLLPAGNILFPDPADSARNEFINRFRQPRDAVNWHGPKLDELLDRIKRSRRFPGIEFLLPLFYPGLSTVLDYLGPDTTVILVDPVEISRSQKLAWERITANFKEAEAMGVPALRPAALFLGLEAFAGKLARFSTLRLYDLPDPEMGPGPGLEINARDHRLLKQELTLHRKKQGLLAPLAEKIKFWLNQGHSVAMACRSPRHARHLAELLSARHIDISMAETPFRPGPAGPEANTLILYDHPLSQGFDLKDEQLHLLSESELFGAQRLGPRRKGRAKSAPPDREVRFEELTLGDVVVHRDHGLGIYEGLISLELQGITNDFLQITYRGGDKLYLPVDRINTVGKYQGLADKTPRIDKLGSGSWILTKKKVKEAVWAVAQDLLKLYAQRELLQGHAFSPPSGLFREMEESFPFEETPGQARAISEVLADLASDKPMDRLVCGDVAYGKTEVAVRAAFKVVEDGFQVAILVPTTVLAEQHAATFNERLRELPVTVASLNRFRPPAEQRRLINLLAEGRLDIVIGTHRLLSRDIKFKKLGLLIIDEEHRFGVSHKEKIKKLRQHVDVLTLTATPIPRTLQMSLLGVRDLSVINTPPEHRRRVLTFVARHDDLVIKEAVIRELQRGGQVFLVHNRVRSIHQMAMRVEKLAPSARVAVAHGQMAGKELEKIMVNFVNQEIDVLVCTTIIESGLDITNANTIIISRADRLGLAEIYQLRGRVGRGSKQSYAYLLVPSMELLSRDAKERLRAIMDCGEIGGGFKLALSDLQIRGGGNILGISQSGHIAAVGYDLYLDLLQKTVTDLKRKAAHREEARTEVDPEINLRISAHIPANYIPDPDQRFIAYRKLAGLAGPEELDDLAEELRDRYGSLPIETANLMEIMTIKLSLKRLLISKLEQGRNNLVFTFHPDTPVQPEQILGMLETADNPTRFTPDSRLVVQLPEGREDAATILAVARETLSPLSE